MNVSEVRYEHALNIDTYFDLVEMKMLKRLIPLFIYSYVFRNASIKLKFLKWPTPYTFIFYKSNFFLN